MFEKKGKLSERLWDVLYPKRCAVCDSVLRLDEEHACRQCMALPQKIEKNFCLKCGRALMDVEADSDSFCEECRKGKFSFEAGRSAFVYDKYMRRSIARFKYHGRAEYAGFYADMLYQMYAGEVRAVKADGILAVPVHAHRKRLRGYNQAALLAEKFSSLSGIPYYDDFLIRTKDTVPQKELKRMERLRNLCQVFSINRSCWELSKHMNCVIIMDDIYTTGSTIEACTRVLKDQGIERVYFLCICAGLTDSGAL